MSNKLKIAINGFGRIGRNVARAIYESGRTDIDIVAINDLGPVETNAHLMRYDSVHGKFPGEITVEGDSIKVGEESIKVLAERDPKNLPWKEMDIDVVMECTGIFTAKDKASHTSGSRRQARSGLSACFRRRQDHRLRRQSRHVLTKDDLVVSNASCTTNCLSPVAFVLNNAIGIEKGMMTTIHSYTQVTSRHSTPCIRILYRARAAAVSMIPTSTGAAKAVGLVLPELNWSSLDGVAIRVPTPNVSVVDLKFVAAVLQRPLTK